MAIYREFFKMAAIFKYWIFDHSSEIFALTVTKVSATDLPHRAGNFGVFVSFDLEYFGL